jgi:hypothetical protein
MCCPDAAAKGKRSAREGAAGYGGSERTELKQIKGGAQYNATLLCFLRYKVTGETPGDQSFFLG